MIGQLALVALYNWWHDYNRTDEMEKKDPSGRTNSIVSVEIVCCSFAHPHFVVSVTLPGLFPVCEVSQGV